jgi:ABC-2 type transport system ATP-binding protein
MNVIEVDQLTKRFGKFTAVDQISLQVGKGEICGFLGPNGAGKSTTIRMLCTLLQPTSGSASVAGFNISKQPEKVREHIGLVAEKLILYDRLTARENLMLFGRLNNLPDTEIKKQITKWITRLQMEQWCDHLTGKFSSGMKQRINIARALIHHPDVLILDEPTLGLDPQTARTIHEFILELSKEGITIVLTTHDMVEAESLSHRIAIIDQGKIVAIDNIPNLKRNLTQNGQTLIEVEVANLTDSMLERLKAMESVTSLSQPDTYRLIIHATGDSCISEIVNTINTAGGQIRTINTGEPTMQDVFLHLTGREMRDEATDNMPTSKEHRPPGWGRASRIR